jgi:hypothetical protein
VSVSPDHTTANVGFVPSPSKTGNYFVDLLLTASPESLASIPVLQNGTAKMSYVAAADLVPTASPTSTTFSNNTTSTQNLSISVPNLAALFTALPDLKTAVGNNSAQLEVFDGGSPLKTKNPYLVTQSNGALSATLNASDFAPVTTAGTAKPFSLAILYSSNAPPWIAGTNYSITVPAPPKP